MNKEEIIGYEIIEEYPHSLPKGTVIDNNNFFYVCSQYPLLFKPIYKLAK